MKHFIFVLAMTTFLTGCSDGYKWTSFDPVDTRGNVIDNYSEDTVTQKSDNSAY